MKFRVLQLSLFVLVLCISASAGKRWGGGSSRGSSRGSSSGSRWGGVSKPSYTRPYSPPSKPSYHPGKQSSSDFLLSESGRPSRPASSHTSPVHTPTLSRPLQSSHPNPPYPHHTPSAPSHTPSAPSHTPSAPAKPSIVNDQHQQSHATVSHSDPYAKQPAQNPHVNAPYVPSGGYGAGGIPNAPHGISVPTVNGHPAGGSAPYPTHLPNHPHPNPSIGSSSYPSNSHLPPYSANPPIHSQTYPSSQNGYHPSMHGGPPPPYNPAGGVYHSGGYQAPPPYHAPPAYQPATQPFVPGRTVYVIPDSHKSSSGPGLGTYIGSAVAGGVAAGATNAIVDHAISSIFRPSSNHIHTYPSAPPVGTPTSTVTTNNYYYGQPGPTDNNSGSTNVNQGSSAPVSSNQAAAQPTVNQPAQSGAAPVDAQPNAGTQANPGVASAAPGSTQGNPSSQTNGVASRAPEGQPEVPPSNVISDEDLMKFTEELFDKADSNLNQYVELNLQKRATNTEPGATVPDEAPEPLFKLKPELDIIPTVSTLRKLYDNYERDGTKKENLTPERRAEENAFLDEILKTTVMTKALNWLGEKKYIESDNFEQRDLLRRMWFNNFDETSSGFERIFLSEKFGDSGIVGMQNWLYFAHLEDQKNVNYLGYADMTSLSGKGSLLKLNYQTEGFTMQNATIFVGTPPELELALYTVCFHARPNNWCPVSLGGAKFFILTHSFRYFGKDLIDLGFPAF